MAGGAWMHRQVRMAEQPSDAGPLRGAGRAPGSRAALCRWVGPCPARGVGRTVGKARGLSARWRKLSCLPRRQFISAALPLLLVAPPLPRPAVISGRPARRARSHLTRQPLDSRALWSQPSHPTCAGGRLNGRLPGLASESVSVPVLSKCGWAPMRGPGRNPSDQVDLRQDIKKGMRHGGDLGGLRIVDAW